MDHKQKRLLIIGIVAVVIVALLFFCISKKPAETVDVVSLETPVETQTTIPAAPAEEVTTAPVLQNTVLPPKEAAGLPASPYTGRCAMNDGSLMYGNVVDLKKGQDPKTLKAVQLRNVVTGEAVTFEVAKGACVFEKPADTTKK